MDFLQQLGIEQENKGVSTGSAWIDSTGAKLESFSPVDGKLIGTVISADKSAYDAAMEKATAAFNDGTFTAKLLDIAPPQQNPTQPNFPLLSFLVGK